MLRFVPDSWSELALRPLLLADPVAGLYTELHAPDWRYLLLALLLALAAVACRNRALLTAPQWRLTVGLTTSFYLWTVVSGNGRYFLWGLLLIGPLVVVAARRLPGTRSLRNTVIVGAVALQGWCVWMTYEPNVWTLRPWTQGPLLARSAHALAAQPAVFVTIGSISYSLLVPTMHPQSRWTNVTGQQDLVPGMREHARFRELIADPLPKYGVIRAGRQVMTDDDQPTDFAWAVIRRAFARHSLAPAAEPCAFLPVAWGGTLYDVSTAGRYERGFWFCRLEATAADPASDPERYAPQLDAVFERIESRCPRFFPAGNAQSRPSDGGVTRHYSHSDTRLTVTDGGIVYFQYMRALNPTVLGRVADVLAGRIALDCRRLPGRYVAPWSRGWGVDLE